MAKSYFAILGVASNASNDEIKSAYRRLAKEFHPDHYKGSNDAFRQIQEAYTVLGNRHRRNEYEQAFSKPSMRVRTVTPGYAAPEPLIAEQRPVQMGEISPIRSFEAFAPSFDELFDWLWSNFSNLSQPKSSRIESLTLEVPLTREQAAKGGNAQVMVPARAACPVCRGYGNVGFYECMRCAGEGAISGEMPVAIAFPPGLTQDHAVVIPLERFGIRNLRLTVVFRPTGADTL